MYFKFAAKELAIAALMLGACVRADAKSDSADALSAFNTSVGDARTKYQSDTSDKVTGCNDSSEKELEKVTKALEDKFTVKTDAIKDTTRLLSEKLKDCTKGITDAAGIMTKFVEKKREIMTRTPFKFEAADANTAAKALETDVKTKLTEVEAAYNELDKIFETNFKDKVTDVFLPAASGASASGKTVFAELADASKSLGTIHITAQEELRTLRDGFKTALENAYDTAMALTIGEDQKKLRADFDTAMYLRSSQYDKAQGDLNKLSIDNAKKMADLELKAVKATRGVDRAVASYTGVIGMIKSHFKISKENATKLVSGTAATYMVPFAGDFSKRIGDMKKTVKEFASFLETELSLKSSGSGSSSGTSSTDTPKPTTATESKTSTMSWILIVGAILLAIILLGGIVYYFTAK